jgi:general stress protein YciG
VPNEENLPMAGTKAGGLKAAQKNLAKDKIGAKGGRNGHTGGFAANPELARVAGAKGGRISRRTKKTDDTQTNE